MMHERRHKNQITMQECCFKLTFFLSILCCIVVLDSSQLVRTCKGNFIELPFHYAFTREQLATLWFEYVSSHFLDYFSKTKTILLVFDRGPNALVFPLSTSMIKSCKFSLHKKKNVWFSTIDGTPAQWDASGGLEIDLTIMI